MSRVRRTVRARLVLEMQADRARDAEPILARLRGHLAGYEISKVDRLLRTRCRGPRRARYCRAYEMHAVIAVMHEPVAVRPGVQRLLERTAPQLRDLVATWLTRRGFAAASPSS